MKPSAGSGGQFMLFAFNLLCVAAGNLSANADPPYGFFDKLATGRWV
jgi:hypothetical protein